LPGVRHASPILPLSGRATATVLPFAAATPSTASYPEDCTKRYAAVEPAVPHPG